MRAGPKGVFGGYLQIHVCGCHAERFFRLCASRDIRLWNLKPCGEGEYRCCIRTADFFLLHPVCRKTKTRVRVARRFGFPNYLRRYSNRALFFAAFFLMLYGVYDCSTYLWKIEINGNSYISDESLIRYLKERGIGFGTKSAAVDTDALSLALRRDFSQIIWASASKSGTTLTVYVKEQLKSVPASSGAVEEGIGTDLVAGKHAIVASIVTREGTPRVVKGDEVFAGDILVGSQTDILDDNGDVLCSLYQNADADVHGYVEYDFSETIPIRRLVYLDADQSRKEWFLQLFDRQFVFPFGQTPYGDCYMIEKKRQLFMFSGFYLPVYFGEREYVRRKTAYTVLAQENARELAKTDFGNFVKELEENGVSIIDKNVMIKEAGSCYEIVGHVSAIEPIAVRRRIELPSASGEEPSSDEHE